MSIFLNKDSKVIVQGITGGEGTKHTALMLKAGTQVVGGVNARKAGTTVSHVAADGSPVGASSPSSRWEHHCHERGVHEDVASLAQLLIERFDAPRVAVVAGDGSDAGRAFVEAGLGHLLRPLQIGAA